MVPPFEEQRLPCSYQKHGLMPDFVPADVMDLEQVVLANLASVRADPKLTRSAWSGSDLA